MDKTTTPYEAPRKLTIHDFDGLSFEKGGIERFKLASSVLRKYQYDKTNDFNYEGKWPSIRKQVILRDGPYDFITGQLIEGPVYVHHLNEITSDTPMSEILDTDTLVPVSAKTHQSIHWAGAKSKPKPKSSDKTTEEVLPSWLN